MNSSVGQLSAVAAMLQCSSNKQGFIYEINWLCKSGRGGGQFRKRISAPTPWYQNPCDASIFLHARPNFRKKVKKLNFQAKFWPFFRVLPSQNTKTCSKIFYMSKRHGHRLGIAKISLKSFESFWSYLKKTWGEFKMTPLYIAIFRPLCLKQHWWSRSTFGEV